MAKKVLQREKGLDGMLTSAKRHLYLLCVLPGLGDFRSVPPVSKEQLLRVVTESEGPADVVQALLLSDDLLQREAALSEEREPDPADLTVLSFQQVKGEDPLPHFLISDQEDAGESLDNPIAVDPIWQNYFQYAFDIARSSRSPFLQAWVGFEIGLRNALATARAVALDLDPGPYLVAEELGDPEFPFESILTDWGAAPNPLEALDVLDKARWYWATVREGWYSFNNDEVAAYTAKIIILHRWRRINEGDKK